MSETTRLPRLLITGSRNHQWTAYDSQALLIAIRDIVEKTQKRPTLVHGGATGTDTEAALHGQRLFNLQTEVHRADWKKYGRAAGPIRNKQMVELRADLCLAFPYHPKNHGGGARIPRHMELHRPRAASRNPRPCCVEPTSVGIQPQSSHPWNVSST